MFLIRSIKRSFINSFFRFKFLKNLLIRHAATLEREVDPNLNTSAGNLPALTNVKNKWSHFADSVTKWLFD